MGETPNTAGLAVHAWLERHELDAYSDRLREAGYSSMRFLQAASEDDIQEAIRDVAMKKGHAKVFMLAWTELVAGLSSVGVSRSTQGALRRAQSVPAPAALEEKDAKADHEISAGDTDSLVPAPQQQEDDKSDREVAEATAQAQGQAQAEMQMQMQMMQMQTTRQVAPRQPAPVSNDIDLVPAPHQHKWAVRMEGGDSPLGYASFTPATLLQEARVTLLQTDEIVGRLPCEWVFVKNAAPVAKKAEGKWRVCDLGYEITIRAKLKSAVARGGGASSQSPLGYHLHRQPQTRTMALRANAAAEQAAAARAKARAVMEVANQASHSSQQQPRQQQLPSGGSALPPWRWENTPENSDAIFDLYRMIDKNESGGISSTELTHMLLNLGEDVSEALVEDMVSMVDKNGDREIDFAEFRSILFGAQPSVNSGGRELVLDPDLRNAQYMTEEVRQEEQSRRNARLRGEALTEQMTERDKFLMEQKFANKRLTRNSGGEGGGSNVPKSGKSVGGPVRYRNDEVRYLFTQMDEDRSGFLDQAEVAKLASKLGHALRPRDLVDAMRHMDPEGTGEVTFEMFRDWLLDTGHHWSDLIVLPEGSVAAVRQKAEQLELLPDLSVDTTDGGDAAAIEWQRLSVLLKLMHSATGLWGKPTEMYGLHVIELERKITELTEFVEHSQSTTNGANEQHQARQQLRALHEELSKISPRSDLLLLRKTKTAGSMRTLELSAEDIENEAMVRKCFFPPMSAFRVVWDLLQVFLLLYLLIVLPVRLSFGIDVPFNSFGFWFDVGVDVYFLSDIFVNFRTGFYDQRGMLVINQDEITRNYLHSWFLIDVGTCIPISYIMMMLHGAETGVCILFENSDVCTKHVSAIVFHEEKLKKGPASAGVEASSKGKQVRMLKILRLLKLAKLLRVTRILRCENIPFLNLPAKTTICQDGRNTIIEQGSKTVFAVCWSATESIS
jgi:Ca2+-binding EF-hand superfamily protein